MADVAVNWKEYFYSIRSVCPWSWAAWQRNEIQITTWIPRQRNVSAIPNGIQAVVHIAKHNPRQLKKMCDRFNHEREHEEWLWSHPDYGNFSTQVPVFIQQDRKLLENARKSAHKLKIT